MAYKLGLFQTKVPNIRKRELVITKCKECGADVLTQRPSIKSICTTCYDRRCVKQRKNKKDKIRDSKRY